MTYEHSWIVYYVTRSSHVRIAMQKTPRISLLAPARCHTCSFHMNLARIFRPCIISIPLCLRSVSKAFGVSRCFLKIAQSIEPYILPSFTSQDDSSIACRRASWSSRRGFGNKTALPNRKPSCANEKMICVYKFKPAILATSKQIHKVAWPILYLENRFIVASCVWNGIFTSMENNQVAAIACTKPNSVARFSVRIPPW